MRATEKAMEPAGWAYYASAADDEVTLRENQAAFGRVWLRPRVMVDVSKIDVQSEFKKPDPAVRFMTRCFYSHVAGHEESLPAVRNGDGAGEAGRSAGRSGHHQSVCR